MTRNSFIFLAVLIFQFSAAFTQKEDDIATPGKPDTTAIITAKRIDELSKIAVISPIDTGMITFHTYNPTYKQSFSPKYLGNTGSAFQNNIFSLRNTQTAFAFADPFLLYYHNPYKRQHFNTHRPFTQVSYVTAGNRETSEQVLSALHTQNYNQFTNIGLEYDLIASRGIYLKQEVKSNRFSLFGSYDKDNYSVYGNISSNKTKALENGGLKNIDNFLVHQANDPIAYQMYLDNASSEVRNLSFFLTQSYRFKRTFIDSTFVPRDTNPAVKDTLTAAGDSLHKAAEPVSVKREKALPFMVNHTFRYERYSRVYIDQIQATDTAAFYLNNYYNLLSAADSAFRHVLENSFQISGDEYKFLPGFIMGVKHQFTGYSYLYPRMDTMTVNSVLTDTILPADFSTTYNNLSVYAMLLFNKKTKITYQGKMEYFFAGYRQNDVLTDFIMNYKLNSKGSTISAVGKFYATEPDFFLKQYYSSHFQWNALFPKTTTTSAYLSFTSGNGTVYAEGGMCLLGNYIYIDNMAIPAKADKNILVSTLRLEKTLKWGGFNHIHKFVFQKVNQESYLQLPLLSYGNTSYYENAFFKGVLKFQLGVDFYINSSYYADAWMPATGMFYRQDKMKVGEYPFLDGFLNWKVKRTRFFLKYTNALAGIAGNNYFTTYGYPMNPGSLKFGLSWTFYD
jgi:hypothetical protein